MRNLIIHRLPHLRYHAGMEAQQGAYISVISTLYARSQYEKPPFRQSSGVEHPIIFFLSATPVFVSTLLSHTPIPVIYTPQAVYSIGKRINARSNLLPSALTCMLSQCLSIFFTLHPAIEWAGEDAEIVDSSRGGDVTYHGPGQLVAYPILDLSKHPHRQDLHWYVRSLEKTMVTTLAAFGVAATAGGEANRNNSGCWIGENAKIGALGINCSAWITSHGIALNVTDEVLPYFQRVIPCGLQSATVTTLEQQLRTRGGISSTISRNELMTRVEDEYVRVFCRVFQLEQ